MKKKKQKQFYIICNCKSFGKNYWNPVITGILRDVPWNSPTLHPKWEAEPDDPRRMSKCA